MHLKVGVTVTSCDKCDKLNKAIDIMSQFGWQNYGAIAYDKNTQEILLVEEQIMRIIQMVNPVQGVRKLRLISQDEYRKLLEP